MYCVRRIISLILCFLLTLSLTAIFQITALAAAAVGTASGTQGYDYIAVQLTSGSFSSTKANVINTANWSLTASGGQTIKSIDMNEADTSYVKISLSGVIAPGDTLQLQAAANVFAVGTEPFGQLAVNVIVPVPAAGTAVAMAGTKDIMVELNSGTFSPSTSTVQTAALWILGGTSAAANSIASVTYTDANTTRSHVKITLTNNINAGENYTITASQAVFVNIAVAPFAAPLPVTVQNNVCQIGPTGYLTLDDALAAVPTGGAAATTIKLLQDINYDKGISITDGRNIIFDLNGYTLKVTNNAGIGLTVTNGYVGYNGSGSFNVIGSSCGVSANGGAASITVSSATATSDGGNGAVALNGGDVVVNGNVKGGYNGASAAGVGSTIVVNGNATGTSDPVGSSGASAGSGGRVTINGGTAQGLMYGAYANGDDALITINNGDSLGTGTYSHGIHVEGGGSVHVTGNVQGTQYGVVVTGTSSSAVIGGNVTVTAAYNGCGVDVESSGTVQVGGNIVANGQSLGVFATSSGKATIDGSIQAQPSRYIQIFNTVTEQAVYIDGSPESRTIPTTKEGYHTYSAGPSTVWVKEAASATYTIAPISNQTMAALTAGYPSGTQDTKTVTIIRTGTGDLVNLAVSLSGTNADDFIITQPDVTTLNAVTPATTFTVKAKNSLSAGIYSAAVMVTADNMVSLTFTVTQEVVASPIVSATILPVTITFDKNPVNQADVSTTITWNDAVSVTDVRKAEMSVGTAVYAVSGNSLTIKKEYLVKHPIGSLVLTVEFDIGNPAMLTISVQDTTLPTGSNPPIWPNGSTLTASGTTSTRTALNWTPAADDIGVTGYRIYQNHTLIQTVTGAAYSCEVTGLSSSATYTFQVQAGDAYNNWTYGPTVTVRTDSSGSYEGSYAPVPAPEPKPVAQVIDSNGNTSNTITIKLDNSTGTASVEADSGSLTTAFDKSKADGKGVKKVEVNIPEIEGARAYEAILPVSFLTSGDAMKAIKIKTGIATLTVPGNMLNPVNAAAAKNVSLTIAICDKSKLDAAVQAQIGERPVIKLSLKIDGKQTSWNNENAQVTVTIPYTPTAAELLNPESIVIWYINDSGKAMPVPNGHYDPGRMSEQSATLTTSPATAGVTFTTTNFSCYVVGYNKVSFKDVPGGVWYNKAVSFIAARGITTGTGNGNYSPEEKLTRGDFLVLLMKAYDISPDANPKDNFADAGSTYYTGYLAAAKRLGISVGVGNNMFAPGKEITRQEMFTLLYNVLKALGRLPQGNSGKTLSDFTDAGDIASWSKEAMMLLIETGTIGGNNGKLFPTSATTRAEIAQVLYNLLHN